MVSQVAGGFPNGGTAGWWYHSWTPLHKFGEKIIPKRKGLSQTWKIHQELGERLSPVPSNIQATVSLVMIAVGNFASLEHPHKLPGMLIQV